MYTYIYTHTHTHTQMMSAWILCILHIYIYICIHTYTHPHIDAECVYLIYIVYIHVYICIHTYTHTHKHIDAECATVAIPVCHLIFSRPPSSLSPPSSLPTFFELHNRYRGGMGRREREGWRERGNTCKHTHTRTHT